MGAYTGTYLTPFTALLFSVTTVTMNYLTKMLRFILLLYRQGCPRSISITLLISSCDTTNIKSRRKNIAHWQDLSFLDQDWVVNLRRRYNWEESRIGNQFTFYKTCKQFFVYWFCFLSIVKWSFVL